MKKRILLIVSLIIVVVFCFLLFAPITFRIQKQIIITAPLIKVANEVTDLKNWLHWNIGLKTKDTSSFKMSEKTNNNNAWLRTDNDEYNIVNENAADITVKEKNAGKEIYHSIFVFPDSNIKVTRVLWIEKLTPVNWLKEKSDPSVNIEANLESLKNYLEDVKQYYGFDIQLQKIKDTLVIAKITVASKTNQQKTLADLYKDILAYANKNDLGINDTTPRMVNFYEINKDSVKIMAAIPVNKKAPLINDLSYLEMPSHGKLLVGFYEGSYTGLKKLYTAMNRYIVDKQLEIIAAPYERFLTNPVSSYDSLHMKIELCYPIF
jgi:effector-binding domain-containing protein